MATCLSVVCTLSCTLQGNSLVLCRYNPCGSAFAATLMICPGRRLVCMAFQIKDDLGFVQKLQELQAVCSVATSLRS